MANPALNLSSLDDAAWRALADAELANLKDICPKCGVCGGYLPPSHGSDKVQSFYTMNSKLKKCGCCTFCMSRAMTTDENYKGTQCFSAANQTICFWTKQQRLEHFTSVKEGIVAHGLKGRPCMHCCEHFGFQLQKK